jgi:two-component system, chemotaxis family, protein-glutamate methylesterase/glutaminase
LPVMSGLAATEYVMAYCPTPILVVSASMNRGEVFKTFDALSAGAVDVLEKPRGDGTDDDWAEHFVATVKLVSRIKVITHPRGRLDAFRQTVAPPIQPAPSGTRGVELVAIGASTGGPGAIASVMRALPSPLRVPLIAVLHLDEAFASAFAEWLDGQTDHRVVYAKAGDRLADTVGRVVIAPPGKHLIVRGARLELISDPPRHSCRPSIDVLFESLARELGPRALGCLLTGMGRDGAPGLLAMRQAGSGTIAQDEATCVVYGMPREAVLLGAAERVLPLHEIGPAIAEKLGRV